MDSRASFRMDIFGDCSVAPYQSPYVESMYCRLARKIDWNSCAPDAARQLPGS